LPDRVDPDEFVRAKGPEALRHVLGQGRGMVEYLIDAELDESFNAADSRECAARVDRVVAVIDRQRDAVQRALAEAYADRAAGRLDLLRSAPQAWPALKRKFLAMRGAARPPSAARTAPRRPERNTHEAFAGQREERPALERASMTQGRGVRRSGHAERKTIIGALLDFPVLLEDSETRAVLGLLEGESARIVAAMQQSMRVNASGQKVLDSSEFLAQMPPVIQAFASARLAAPQHDTIDDARATLAANAKKLEAGHVAQGKTEIVRAERRAVGDWETEVELMKSAQALVRQRHGFEGTRVENTASEVGAGVRTRVGQKHRGSDGDQES
jgi:DNA primase